MALVWWLSLGLCVLVAAVCVHLYLDGRGQRRALSSLQARVARQDAVLGQLGRAVALLGNGTPPVDDGAAHRRALFAAEPVHAASDEWPTVTIPRRLTDEEGRRLLDSLPAPSRSNMTLAEHIAEHFGGLLRDAGKTVGVDHCCKAPACYGATSDVCACPCLACDRRRTLLTQSQRTWGLPHAVRMRGEARDAWALRSGARSLTFAARFEALREAAEARGQPVDHCAGRACKQTGGCACACGPCVRLRSFLARAEQQPPPPGDADATLCADDRTRADALAARLGISQDEALGLCLVAWRGADVPSKRYA
jgi:hypothetical protein